MCVGPDQRKKRLNFGKDTHRILDTKKNPVFLEMHPSGGLHSMSAFKYASILFYCYNYTCLI